MSRQAPRLQGWVAFGLAAAAAGWCALLVLAAFVYPAYSGQECRAGAGGAMVCVEETATDFAMNGWSVVFMLAAAGGVSLLVLLALSRVCTTGSPAAKGAAWAGIGLMLAFSYVTGFSIGMLLLPTVALLVASALLTPRPASG